MTNQRFRLPTRLILATTVGGGRGPGACSSLDMSAYDAAGVDGTTSADSLARANTPAGPSTLPSSWKTPSHLGALEPSPPEALAALTPLVLLPPDEASAALRRRSTPHWLQIYLGLLARPDWRGRGRSGGAERTYQVANHAAHWSWLESRPAMEAMAMEAEQGATVLVARVWVPVRGQAEGAGAVDTASASEVLVLGQPRLELFKGFCWMALTADLAVGQARAIEAASAGPVGSSFGVGLGLSAVPGKDTFWRRHPERLAGRYLGADGRGWVEGLC